MGRRMRLITAIGMAALAAGSAAAPAHGAASGPKVTAGEGNTLTLTYAESTTSYGLRWYVPGKAYQVTGNSDPGDCTLWSEDSGIICTFTSTRSGTVTVSMTTDKPVSPNTSMFLRVDSQGAEDQEFSVLVEGTGAIAQPPPQQPPQQPPPPPEKPKDPIKQKEKDDAAESFRQGFEAAKVPCAMAAAGAGVATSALVLPGFSGVALGVTGGEMVVAAGGMCAPYIAQLIKDYNTWHDPPDPNVAQVALAAFPKARTARRCRSGRARATCRRLRQAIAAWQTAGDRLKALAAAYQTTVNRQSAADTAGDLEHRTLQDSAIRLYAGMIATAQRRWAAAGRRVAILLRRKGVRFRAPASFAQKGAAAITAKLTAAGIPAAAFAPLLGAPAPPRPADVLAILGRAPDTRSLDDLAHGLTGADAATLLGAIAAQTGRTPQAVRAQLVAAGAFLP